MTLDQVVVEFSSDEDASDEKAADKRTEALDKICEQCNWTPAELAAQPIDDLCQIIHRLAGFTADKAWLGKFVHAYLISKLQNV